MSPCTHPPTPGLASKTPDTNGAAPKLSKTKVFIPGQITRHFVPVPEGATWAYFSAHNVTKEQAGKFILHTVQILPNSMVKTMEYYKMFNLTENGTFGMAIPVKSGPSAVVEFCLAKWWANLGSVEADYSQTTE